MKKNLTCALVACLLFFCPVSTQASSPVKVDYALPYPGILPDSPVYILKIIRDNISQFLISHPIKKAEFDMNHADVFIASALSLAEKKRSVSIIEDSLGKAEDYFKQALKNTQQAKMQGIDVTGIAKRLVLSNRKHQEIINEIEKKLGKSLSAKKRIQFLGVQAKKISS